MNDATINSVLATAEQLAPNIWLQALIIIAGSLILAKIAQWFLLGVIQRLTRRTVTVIDDTIIELLHRPVFTTVAVFGLMVASARLREPMGEQIATITIALLQSIIILSWIVFLLRASGLLLNGMAAQEDRYNFAQKDTVPLMRNLSFVFLLLVGAYWVMIAWDIDVTGLLASAGIVGLALSFAAQDTLSHLFAGVAILADRPYKVGDYIVLDTGERGEVRHIGLRSTRLMTRDDVEVSIPNGVMGGAKIVNESGGSNTRFRIRAAVGAAYGSDVEKVLTILEEVALANEKLSKAPAPRARFRAFGDSSLDFELLAWISNPADRGIRVHELNIAIYRRFAEEGIQIPFPQQDIYIKELPAQNDD